MKLANDGYTALNIAAHQGHQQIVQLVLDHGANPHVFNPWVGSRLTEATDKGHDQIRSNGIRFRAKKADPIGATMNDLDSQETRKHPSFGSVSPTQAVLFYRVKDAWGCFSNFAPYPMTLKGKIWPTVEHYFQAQKFVGTGLEEAMRLEKSPMKVARMGRDRTKKLREDWDAVKDDIMREALRAKFLQHPDLRDILLSTGDAEIVEHTPNDNYWADGGDGSGQNLLGKMLMEIRALIREGML